MTVGQLVVHKLTGKEMRVKSISETIASCELIHEEKEWSMMREKMVYKVAVCSFDNLVEKEEQLKIFV